MTCIDICKERICQLNLIPCNKEDCDFILIHSIYNNIPHVSIKQGDKNNQGEVILLYLMDKNTKNLKTEFEYQNNLIFYENLIQNNNNMIQFNQSQINNLDMKINGGYSGYSCMYHTEKIGWINSKLGFLNSNSMHKQQNIQLNFEIQKLKREKYCYKSVFKISHYIKNLDVLLQRLMPDINFDFTLLDYQIGEYDQKMIDFCKHYKADTKEKHFSMWEKNGKYYVSTENKYDWFGLPDLLKYEPQADESFIMDYCYFNYNVNIEFKSRKVSIIDGKSTKKQICSKIIADFCRKKEKNWYRPAEINKSFTTHLEKFYVSYNEFREDLKNKVTINNIKTTLPVPVYKKVLSEQTKNQTDQSNSISDSEIDLKRNILKPKQRLVFDHLEDKEVFLNDEFIKDKLMDSLVPTPDQNFIRDAPKKIIESAHSSVTQSERKKKFIREYNTFNIDKDNINKMKFEKFFKLIKIILINKIYTINNLIGTNSKLKSVMTCKKTFKLRTFSGNVLNTDSITTLANPADYFSEIEYRIENYPKEFKEIKSKLIQNCTSVSPYLYLYNLRVFLNIFTYSNNISYKTKNLCTLFGNGYPISIIKLNKHYRMFIRSIMTV